MNEELSLPSSREARVVIERLKTMPFPIYNENADMAAIFNVVQDSLRRFISPYTSIPSFPVPYEFDDERLCFLKTIYRIRPLSQLKDINKQSEHSYPPPEFSKSYGRCNLPHHPVFYGSISPHTAFYEVSNIYSSEKDFCLSVWETKRFTDTKLIENFGFPPFNNKYDPDTLKKIWKDSLMRCETMDVTEDQAEGFYLLREFLQSCFLMDKHYYLSSYLGHVAFNKDYFTPTDILIYHSQHTGYESLNCAIRKEFVDECLQLKKLVVIRLGEKTKTHVDFIALKVGEIVGDSAFWRDYIEDVDLPDLEKNKQIPYYMKSI